MLREWDVICVNIANDVFVFGNIDQVLTDFIFKNFFGKCSILPLLLA